MYPVKVPKLVQQLYPHYIWRIPTTEKRLYLTFDDGPIPELTPWVLDTLKEYHAKATFFCVGENAARYPELVKRILDEGHALGNHTYNHLRGSNTPTLDYIANTLKCEPHLPTTLFRPPYGRIKREQAKALQARGYQIVMWDVLSGDFDRRISKEKCLENVLGNVGPGSVVVFHDSLKAEGVLRWVLGKVLNTLDGWEFDALSVNS